MRWNVSPHGLIFCLGYPVISLTTEYTHRFSREMVLGKELDPELAGYLSKRVAGHKPHSPNLYVPYQCRRQGSS
ncbi:MAG: hypothetical protein U0T82_09845 [Bacteroidales bacterium]